MAHGAIRAIRCTTPMHLAYTKTIRKFSAMDVKFIYLDADETAKLDRDDSALGKYASTHSNAFLTAHPTHPIVVRVGFSVLLRADTREQLLNWLEGAKGAIFKSSVPFVLASSFFDYSRPAQSKVGYHAGNAVVSTRMLIGLVRLQAVEFLKGHGRLDPLHYRVFKAGNTTPIRQQGPQHSFLLVTMLAGSHVPSRHKGKVVLTRSPSPYDIFLAVREWTDGVANTARPQRNFIGQRAGQVAGGT